MVIRLVSLLHLVQEALLLARLWAHMLHLAQAEALSVPQMVHRCHQMQEVPLSVTGWAHMLLPRPRVVPKERKTARMWHRHPKALLSVVLSVGMSHQVLAAELMV